MRRSKKNPCATADNGIYLVYLDEDGRLSIHRFDMLVDSLQYITGKKLGKQDYVLFDGELIRGSSLSDKLKAKRIHDDDAVIATRQMLSSQSGLVPDEEEI